MAGEIIPDKHFTYYVVKIYKKFAGWFPSAIQSMLTQCRNALLGKGSLQTGHTLVAAAGTAVRLNGGASVPLTSGQQVFVRALHTNTDEIYVGGPTVTAANGAVLEPGEGIDLHVTNVNIIYIDAAVNNEGVSWIVER